MELDSKITIRISRKLKEEVERKKINVEKIVENALTEVLEDEKVLENYKEILCPPNLDLDSIQSTSISTGSFMRIPNLSLEDYERIVDESSWEYLDDILLHRSPESNQHNAILNLITQRMKNNLDPHQFIIRTSRVALSIGNDKPEPDLMVFERDTFRKKKRKDQSESEIVDATPILIIEIISKSSDDLDQMKVKKYCSIGVKEIWRIFQNKTPFEIIVSILKEGSYKEIIYTQGEVRSQTLPTFAIRFEELKDPDSYK